jgi:hypothetical protein
VDLVITMVTITDHQFVEVAGDVVGCACVRVPICIRAIGSVCSFLIGLLVVVVVHIAPAT